MALLLRILQAHHRTAPMSAGRCTVCALPLTGDWLDDCLFSVGVLS